jgi:two-component system, LuxR family, sensor kinase FixL
MSWIHLLWPMMGAASLTVGLIHLTIWARQRAQVAHLIFSIAALSVMALSLCELLLMLAQTPAQYATVLRWAHPVVAVLVVSLVGFVQVRFALRISFLALAACILRVGSLIPNFTTGVNLNFDRITALKVVEIFGHGNITVPVGDPNPWMIVGQLSNVLLVLFLLQSILSVRRRPDAHERRKALLICGSILGFVALSSLWTAVVVLGMLPGPLTINVAFFGIVVVVGYELGGEVLRAAQLARSLTKTESDLRESQQQMALAVEAAGIGLWNWDIGSDSPCLTGHGNDLFDMRPVGNRMDGEHAITGVHPDDVESMRQAREEAIQGTGVYFAEFRLLPLSGGTRWLAARGKVEYSPDGQAQCLRGVVYDVTERRQAEERFRLVVDGAQSAMIMSDSNGIITLANAQAERVFGYTREELLGKPVAMLLPHYSRGGYLQKRAHPVEPPEVRPAAASGEVHGYRKDGTKVPLEIGLTPLWVSEELLVLASITDISERLRSEQEIALQRDEVAHLSRVAILGEISGSLAHELNQPLTSILSNAQAALRFLEHSPANIGEVRESLVQIVDSDKRASEVIRRLRAMLRKERIEFQKLDINGVVRDVVRLLDSDLLNRGVSVVLDLEPSPPRVYGDRVQLQQVLLNLIVNGCDAMKDMESGRTLRLRTNSSDGTSVTVSIHDLGHGIPPDDLERIFMPFVTSKPEGVGLGLAICGTIIRTHRGRIWAANNTGQGATFHFQLPSDASREA